MRKLILAGLVATLLTGCGNFWNQVDRSVSATTPGDYHIIKYSGGKVVEEYWLRNVQVTQEQTTDGVFFVKDGAIYELSGDTTVVRLKTGFAGSEVIPSHVNPAGAVQVEPASFKDFDRNRPTTISPR